ncbi:MAG: hypothetical protein ACREA1_07000, partial [Nitrosotalea sp.]
MLDSADDDSLGGVVTDLAPVISARTPQALVQGVLASLPGHSPDPWVCPFLRRATDEGLVAPGPGAAPTHRCAALTAPIAPSIAQQELLCLGAAHAGCPRFRQGTAAIAVGLGVTPARGPLPTLMQLASVVVLVAVIGVLGLFVLGGVPLLPGTAGTSPTPSGLAALASTATPPASSASIRPSPAPSAPVTPAPTPTPTFPPSPTPATTPPGTAAHTPTPSSGGSIAAHWDGLARCTGGQDC